MVLKRKQRPGVFGTGALNTGGRRFDEGDETFQFVAEKDKALAQGEKGLNGRWIVSVLVTVECGSRIWLQTVHWLVLERVIICVAIWQLGVDMEFDSGKGESKVITAGELVIILEEYHSAIARLGSGIISLSGALKHSRDAEVKEAADEA